jgi:hypothetical protein
MPYRMEPPRLPAMPMLQTLRIGCEAAEDHALAGGHIVAPVSHKARCAEFPEQRRWKRGLSCGEGKWCPGAESNHRHCDFQL